MRALVLSGGAAWGAYQAGALAVLAEEGVEFDIAIGVSAGAMNAAAYAQGIGERLPWIWRNYAPLFVRCELLAEGRSPFCFSEATRRISLDFFRPDRIRASRTELVTPLTDFATGDAVSFSSRYEAFTEEELRAQFEAATSIPGLSEEPILVRGRRYCDGGFASLVPLREAIARGASEVWLVDCVKDAAAFARVACLFLRPLKLLPIPFAKLLAGYLHDVKRDPPRYPGRLVLIAPSERLGYFPFDFRLAGMERAIEIGRRDAARVLASERARFAPARPPRATVMVA